MPNVVEDVVLDPFLGSGQVAVIAKEMNRNYAGFEIVKEYFNFVQKRLEETTIQSLIDAEIAKEVELNTIDERISKVNTEEFPNLAPDSLQ